MNMSEERKHLVRICVSYLTMLAVGGGIFWIGTLFLTLLPDTTSTETWWGAVGLVVGVALVGTFAVGGALIAWARRNHPLRRAGITSPQGRSWVFWSPLE